MNSPGRAVVVAVLLMLVLIPGCEAKPAEPTLPLAV